MPFHCPRIAQARQIVRLLVFLWRWSHTSAGFGWIDCCIHLHRSRALLLFVHSVTYDTPRSSSDRLQKPSTVPKSVSAGVCYQDVVVRTENRAKARFVHTCDQKFAAQSRTPTSRKQDTSSRVRPATSGPVRQIIYARKSYSGIARNRLV